MSAFDREDCTVKPRIEIEERLLQVICLVDMLELALGDEALGTARRQLRELDATSAMDVLKLLDQTAKVGRSLLTPSRRVRNSAR